MEAKGLSYLREESDDLPEVIRGDRQRVFQIVSNLFENALKSTTAGTISTRTVVLADQIIFSITDTGCGISPEQLEAVFDPFTSFSPSGGTGLGLPISRRLAEAMGGSLSVESTPEKGSCFTICLPYVEPAEKFVLTAPNPVNTLHLTEPLEVLVVDDLPENLRLIRLLLADTPYVLTIVESGLHALELIRTRRFDVLLTDICMSEMDGITLVRTIRADERKSNARPMRIIGLSANASHEDREAALKAGCGGGGGGPSADTAKPDFVSAVISGNTLVLTFGEPLDAVNIPAAGAFTVKVNGTTVSLAATGAVVVNSTAKTVTLTLAAAVYTTDTVTVYYTDPTAVDDINALQDLAGNDVASLAGQAVTNAAPPSMKGYWGGTSGTVTTSAIVLANGDAWFVFSESAAISRFARLQMVANGTSFSSTGSQYLLQTGTKETATATGAFSEKTVLSGAVAAASGNTTIALTYNSLYGTPAIQADAVGAWTGSFGGNSSSRTMTVTSTGALTGTSTPGCSYSGTMLVRSADPSVFDVNVTESCVDSSTKVLSGIATVNAAKTDLFIALTTADKASGALFVGQKPLI